MSTFALLMLLVALAAASLLTPALRRPLPSVACIVPLWLGSAALAAAGLLWPLAGSRVALHTAMLGVVAAMPAFWISRAPFPGLDASSTADTDFDSGGDDGGSRRDTPQRPSQPPGDGIDWTAFDRARVQWTTDAASNQPREIALLPVK
jgi:hypothetical protein